MSDTPREKVVRRRIRRNLQAERDGLIAYCKAALQVNKDLKLESDVCKGYEAAMRVILSKLEGGQGE